MSEFKKTAVLGGGVIGASWTALFLAAGKDVCVFDVDEQAPRIVSDYIDRAWPTLLELGLAQEGRRGALCFARSMEGAVDDADFVQENLPERLDLKLEAFGRIEPCLKDNCIVASSASGLMVREMQAGWEDPSNFVLGHPFNPPHLIPLVEVIGNEQTAPEAIDAAEAFYEDVGKVTIRVNKEVPDTSPTACRLRCGVRPCIWSKRAWRRWKMSIRRSGPDPACAGAPWGRTCCSIWGPERAVWRRSVSAMQRASIAGGMTWASPGWMPRLALSSPAGWRTRRRIVQSKNSVLSAMHSSSRT